jgi:hypothetical protein
MFPSETTLLVGRVGLVVGETVLGLYVRSVEGGRDEGAVDPVPLEGCRDGGAVDPVALVGVGRAGAVDPVAVEGVGDEGAFDPVAVEGVVTGEPGSVEPPEDGVSVCGETAELLSAPDEQAVMSEAHRIAITAATRRPRHLWARRTIGGTGGVRAGRVLSLGCAGT